MVVVQTVAFSGGLFSLLLSLILKRYLTQMKILVIGVGVSIIGLVIVVLSPYLWMTTIGLFLCFGARSTNDLMTVTYLSDISSEQTRMTTFVIVDTACAAGISLVGLAFWLIKPWWLALTLYEILPLIVAFVLMLKYSEETPQ